MDLVFVYLVFGKEKHVILRYILVQQVLITVQETENVLQLHKLIQHHGHALVSMDFVERNVMLFVENVQITVVVMESAQMGNVLVMSDSQEMIVHLLNQFILVQTIVLEEDTVNKLIQQDQDQHINVFAILASQDLIVLRQRFSAQVIALVKVFANVMEHVLVKMDTQELLVNKLLKLVQVTDIVQVMEFATMEHAVAIQDLQESIALLLAILVVVTQLLVAMLIKDMVFVMQLSHLRMLHVYVNLNTKELVVNLQQLKEHLIVM